LVPLGRGSEVTALELSVDAAPPGDAGQQPEDPFECGVATGQTYLSHLEHQRRLERVAGHAVLAHEPVGREPVGDAKPVFEAGAAGPKLDLDDAAVLARIAPGVEAPDRCDGLVAWFELVVDAVPTGPAGRGSSQTGSAMAPAGRVRRSSRARCRRSPSCRS